MSTSNKKPENKHSSNAVKQDSTSFKVGNFLWIGIVLTVVDYAIYEILLFTIFQGNIAMVGPAATISALVATLVAYLLHSRITWRARDPGRFGVIKFFLWNGILALAIRPFLAWVMGLLTVIYDFAYGISEWLHLPFTHDFVTSTGVFVFITIITMIINYFVYDTLIFGKAKTATSKKPQPNSKKEEK